MVMKKSSLLIMMLCNLIPFIIITSIIIICINDQLITTHKIIASLAILYILPAIVARVTLSILPISRVKTSLDSKEHLVWWFTFNLQVLFTRFQFLEEFLRIIPGIYSFWLRLWGAKIGKFTYWSPLVTISDRSFLEIGDNVVIGAGARLIPHLVLKDKQQRPIFMLDKIRLCDNVILGGYSVLGPGTNIEKNTCTRAFHISKPFTNITQETISEVVH